MRKTRRWWRCFAKSMSSPREHWDAYEMCEKLVDVEEYFQLWSFRHMKTVERIIGFRQGTGGSSGVGFLAGAGVDVLSGAAGGADGVEAAMN